MIQNNRIFSIAICHFNLPTYLSCAANVFIMPCQRIYHALPTCLLPCQSLHLSIIRTKLSYLDMRSFEKIAARKEQELLFTLQPKRKLQAKQKVIWTINTKDVRYECIAIGRRPNGIEVEEWSNSSELSPIALQGQGWKSLKKFISQQLKF